MKKVLLIVFLFVNLLCLIQCHYNKEVNMKHKFSFYTQYNQFYLEDKNVKGDIAFSNYWTEQTVKDKLALANGIIGVGTQSYGNIKGEIEVLEKPSNVTDYSSYDHVVEGGINIVSGELQILDCPNSHLELAIKVMPGKYRVRIYGSNFASVRETDLANDEDNDYYTIEIWPDDNMESKILKRFTKK